MLIFDDLSESDLRITLDPTFYTRESLYISPKNSLHSVPESNWPFFSLLLQCQRKNPPPTFSRVSPQELFCFKLDFLLLPRSPKTTQQHVSCLFSAFSGGVSWMGFLNGQDSESFCFMGFETSKAAEMAVQDLDQSISSAQPGCERGWEWWHDVGCYIDLCLYYENTGVLAGFFVGNLGMLDLLCMKIWGSSSLWLMFFGD